MAYRRSINVFLSSTFADLKEERNAIENVIARMNDTFVGMEHFGSFADVPLKRCRELVRKAHILVLVLAHH